MKNNQFVNVGGWVKFTHFSQDVEISDDTNEMRNVDFTAVNECAR